jgi:hypothetical protein
MLVKFGEWRAFIPDGKQGQQLDILHGCFVGLRNPNVVKALHVIYID